MKSIWPAFGKKADVDEAGAERQATAQAAAREGRKLERGKLKEALEELKRCAVSLNYHREASKIIGKDGLLAGGKMIEQWPSLKSLMRAFKVRQKDRLRGNVFGNQLSEEQANAELIKMLEVWKSAGYPLDEPFKGGGGLQCACRLDLVGAVEWLLGNGVNPNGQAPKESPPLALAGIKGNWPLMKKLLEAGADPTLGQEKSMDKSLDPGFFPLGRRMETLLSACAKRGSKEALLSFLAHDWGKWESQKGLEIEKANVLLQEKDAFHDTEEREKKMGLWKSIVEERELGKIMPDRTEGKSRPGL